MSKSFVTAFTFHAVYVEIYWIRFFSVAHTIRLCMLQSGSKLVKTDSIKSPRTSMFRSWV